MATTILSDLYSYNDWANAKLLQRCDGLSDAQLDQPREMGLGTLRTTWRHLAAAEQVWLERWLGHPWTPLDVEVNGVSLDDIQDNLRSVAGKRAQLMADEKEPDLSRIVPYQNSAGLAFAHRLSDLMLHVANHGVHHRAQVLNYMKQFGRTVPGGVNYIFYKLAFPTTPQDSASIEAIRGYGLDVSTGEGDVLQWNANLLLRYFAYGDWATNTLLNLACALDNEQLDRDFAMGAGSIRKTFLHLFDAEQWWDRNWHAGPGPLPETPETTPIAELIERWTTLAAVRNAMIAAMNAEEAQRVVTASACGPPTHFRVVESMLQLCVHGTHHRAQLVNMLRHSDAAPPNIDYVLWLREEPDLAA